MSDNPYNWTDNPTETGVAECDPDVLNENLMYLNYEVKNNMGGYLGSTINDVPTSATIIGYLPELGQELDTASYPALYSQIAEAFCDDLVFTQSSSHIQNMTSNNTNGYIASGSSTTGGGNDYYKAFTGNYSDVWLSARYYGLNQYLNLAFPSTQAIYAVGLSAGNSITLGTGVGKISGNGNKLADIVKTSWAALEELLTVFDTPKLVSNIRLDMYSPYSQTANDYLAASLKIYSNIFTSFYKTAHAYVTGDAVKCKAFGGTMHTGITEGTTYYARKTDTDHFTLHPSAADATNNTNQIIPTAVGTGVCKIYKAGKFKLKNSVNGIYTNFIKAQ